MERITSYIPGTPVMVAMVSVLWLAMTLGTAFAS